MILFIFTFSLDFKVMRSSIWVRDSNGLFYMYQLILMNVCLCDWCYNKKRLFTWIVKLVFSVVLARKSFYLYTRAFSQTKGRKTVITAAFNYPRFFFSTKFEVYVQKVYFCVFKILSTAILLSKILIQNV